MWLCELAASYAVVLTGVCVCMYYVCWCRYEWTVSLFPPHTFIDGHPPPSIGFASTAFLVRGSSDDRPDFDPGLDPGSPVDIWVRKNSDDWVLACPGQRLETQCEVVVDDLDLGSYLLLVKAVDAVGNEDATPAQWLWSVDGCSHAEFARVDPADGGLTCAPCPTGASCGVSDGDNVTEAMIHAIDGCARACVSCVVVSAGCAPWTHLAVPNAGTGLRALDSTTTTLARCPRLVLVATRPSNHAVPTATRDCCGMLPHKCLGGVVVVLTLVVVAVACSSLCREGYFVQFGKCRPCGDDKKTTYLVMALIAVVLLAVGGVVFLLREVLPVTLVRLCRLLSHMEMS